MACVFPRQQFMHAERLGHVVVGSHFQSDDAIRLLARKVTQHVNPAGCRSVRQKCLALTFAAYMAALQ